MPTKKQSVIDRIKHLEEAITKGREYLETGANAHWHGFHPLFTVKIKDGRRLPPHKDWMRNVFLPKRERSLRMAQDLLDRLE